MKNIPYYKRFPNDNLAKRINKRKTDENNFGYFAIIGFSIVITMLIVTNL